MADECFTLTEFVIYTHRAGDITFINVNNEEEDNESTSYFKEVYRNTPVLECTVEPYNESDNGLTYNFFISTFAEFDLPLFVFWRVNTKLELFAEVLLENEE